MEFKIKGSMLPLYEADTAYYWLDVTNRIMFEKFKDKQGVFSKHETSEGIMHLLASNHRTLVYGKDGNIIAKNW